MALGRFFPRMVILAECSREPLDPGDPADSGLPQGGRGTQIAVSDHGLNDAQEFSR